MTVPSYVKSYPFFSKGIPRGFAFLKWLFLREDVYKNLISSKPSPESMGVLIHEQEHRKRITSLWSSFRYWLNPDFRFQEELAADRARFVYLKRHKVKFDFEKRAKGLSSWLYLWMMPYARARRELDKAWEAIG